jgi:hypothetical protein
MWWCSPYGVTVHMCRCNPYDCFVHVMVQSMCSVVVVAVRSMWWHCLCSILSMWRIYQSGCGVDCCPCLGAVGEQLAWALGTCCSEHLQCRFVSAVCATVIPHCHIFKILHRSGNAPKVASVCPSLPHPFMLVGNNLLHGIHLRCYLLDRGSCAKRLATGDMENTYPQKDSEALLQDQGILGTLTKWWDSCITL